NFSILCTFFLHVLSCNIYYIPSLHDALPISKDMKLGDSIAVNGVCLTVTDFSEDYFTMDVMPETFHHTSLSFLKHQSSINLDRALRAVDRFGAHFVTGHVDGVDVVIYIKINE